MKMNRYEGVTTLEANVNPWAVKCLGITLDFFLVSTLTICAFGILKGGLGLLAATK